MFYGIYLYNRYKNTDITKHKKVIQEIKAGTIKPDKDGIIILSGEYKTLSHRSRAYYTKINGEIAVLFVEWIGKGVNFDGILYTRHPLAEGDEITINSFTIIKPYVSPVKAYVEWVIEDNWYAASHRLCNLPEVHERYLISKGLKPK